MKPYALNTEKRRFARQHFTGLLLAGVEAYACMGRRLREEAVIPSSSISLDQMGINSITTSTNSVGGRVLKFTFGKEVVLRPQANVR